MTAVASARAAHRSAALRAALACRWAARTEARLARLAEDRARRLPARLLADIGLTDAPAPDARTELWPGVPPHRAPLANRSADA